MNPLISAAAIVTLSIVITHKKDQKILKLQRDIAKKHEKIVWNAYEKGLRDGAADTIRMAEFYANMNHPNN